MADDTILKREKYESSRDFATRLLASMFQEVYSHTGRQMPSWMFDRCSDFIETVLDIPRDEEHRRK